MTDLISSGKFKPLLRQTSGGQGWAARIRMHKNKPVIHFMNTAMEGVPHATLKDVPGVPILVGINSRIENNNLTYEISKNSPDLTGLKICSPELGTDRRAIKFQKLKNGNTLLTFTLENINVYAVAQA